MLIIHKCFFYIVVSHREILVSKHIPTVLNKLLESIIKYIIGIKFENLFQKDCENINADNVTLLFQTEVSWQRTMKFI